MAVSVMVVKQSFVYVEEGIEHFVPKGATVRVGHPLLTGREEYFKPLKVDFEYESPGRRNAAQVGRER